MSTSILNAQNHLTSYLQSPYDQRQQGSPISNTYTSDKSSPASRNMTTSGHTPDDGRANLSMQGGLPFYPIVNGGCGGIYSFVPNQFMNHSCAPMGTKSRTDEIRCLYDLRDIPVVQELLKKHQLDAQSGSIYKMMCIIKQTIGKQNPFTSKKALTILQVIELFLKVREKYWWFKEIDMLWMNEVFEVESQNCFSVGHRKYLYCYKYRSRHMPIVVVNLWVETFTATKFYEGLFETSMEMKQQTNSLTNPRFSSVIERSAQTITKPGVPKLPSFSRSALEEQLRNKGLLISKLMSGTLVATENSKETGPFPEINQGSLRESHSSSEVLTKQIRPYPIYISQFFEVLQLKVENYVSNSNNKPRCFVEYGGETQKYCKELKIDPRTNTYEFKLIPENESHQDFLLLFPRFDFKKNNIRVKVSLSNQQGHLLDCVGFAIIMPNSSKPPSPPLGLSDNTTVSDGVELQQPNNSTPNAHEHQNQQTKNNHGSSLSSAQETIGCKRSFQEFDKSNNTADSNSLDVVIRKQTLSGSKQSKQPTPVPKRKFHCDDDKSDNDAPNNKKPKQINQTNRNASNPRIDNNSSNDDSSCITAMTDHMTNESVSEQSDNSNPNTDSSDMESNGCLIEINESEEEEEEEEIEQSEEDEEDMYIIEQSEDDEEEGNTCVNDSEEDKEQQESTEEEEEQQQQSDKETRQDDEKEKCYELVERNEQQQNSESNELSDMISKVLRASPKGFKIAAMMDLSIFIREKTQSTFRLTNLHPGKMFKPRYCLINVNPELLLTDLYVSVETSDKNIIGLKLPTKNSVLYEESQEPYIVKNSSKQIVRKFPYQSANTTVNRGSNVSGAKRCCKEEQFRFMFKPIVTTLKKSATITVKVLILNKQTTTMPSGEVKHTLLSKCLPADTKFTIPVLSWNIKIAGCRYESRTSGIKALSINNHMQRTFLLFNSQEGKISLTNYDQPPTHTILPC